MAQAAVIQLVKSLSKSEKRHFKLVTKKQSGNKDYLDMFDIIDQTNIINKEMLIEKFSQSHPTASLDNTAAYLLKLLSDCLVQSKIKEDSVYQLLHGLLRVNLLKERSLPQEAYKELKKLKQLAIVSQEHNIQYIIQRYELNYLSEINFEGISEKYLVEMQVRSRELLRDLRNVHEHHSLYELLKHRLIYTGKSVSEDNKKRLNDLLLSEMSIVNARVKHSLESLKLHLLFQSFFFTDVGDYKSALKTFHELNRLFEKNAAIWRHPPSEYLSVLDGILDSLRVIGRYDEMSFYINKLEHLDNATYPEYFRLTVRRSIIIYRLTILLHTQELKAAIKIIEKSDSDLLKALSFADDDKQNELIFYIALTWFRVKNFKKAQKCINSILLIRRISHHSPIFKASQLLNILIRYEEKDLEYLEYEIRSYKRSRKGQDKLSQTEKLIFKVIKINPDFNNSHKNSILWKSIVRLVESAEKDKYEMHIRKYFDFIRWVRDRFGR